MDSQKILGLLATQEETIGKLYHVYQGLFADQELWIRLIKDESNHAAWLRALAQEEKAIFDKERFSADAVQTMTDYINRVIGEPKDYPLLKALGISYDIENSLLEKNFFEVYRTDSAELQRVFNNLANETKIHRTMVKEALDAAKANG
jgi:rubrerythrin